MTALSRLVLAFGFCVTALMTSAEEPAAATEIPVPVKQHEWLQRFVGEWETKVEVTNEPGQPSLMGKGTESARMLGGFWVVGQGQCEIAGMHGTMTSLFTLGYDPQKKKYVGTWVDSMNNFLWKYEGSVEASGKVLTLETQGPSPLKDGLVRFKEVTEFRTNDLRVFTSSMQGDDGKWITMVKAEYRRKK